jgi:hypothetical protein
MANQIACPGFGIYESGNTRTSSFEPTEAAAVAVLNAALPGLQAAATAAFNTALATAQANINDLCKPNAQCDVCAPFLIPIPPMKWTLVGSSPTGPHAGEWAARGGYHWIIYVDCFCIRG